MAEETTTQDNHIKPISEATQTNLLANSVCSLPNNPSELGYTADEIKRAFYKPFIDWEGSLLAEVRRVITEANAAFYALESDTEAKIDALELDTEAKIDELESDTTEKIDALAKGTVKKTDAKSVLYGTNESGEYTYSVSDSGGAGTVVKRDSNGKIAGVVNNSEVDKEALAKFEESSDAVSLNKSFQVNGNVKINGNLDFTGESRFIDTDVLRVDAPISILNASVLDGDESDWVNGGTALLLSNGQAFGVMYSKNEKKFLLGLGTITDGKFTFDEGYKQVVGCEEFKEKAIPSFDKDGNLLPSGFDITKLQNIDSLSKTSLKNIEAKEVNEPSSNSTLPYLQVTKNDGSTANTSLEILFNYFASLPEYQKLVERVRVLETVALEYIEDSAILYKKTVPFDAAEVALVNRVGGMSYKSSLLPEYKVAVWENNSFSHFITVGSYTHSGLEFEFYGDGSIKVNGTAGQSTGGGYSFSILHAPQTDGSYITEPIYLDGTYTFSGLTFGANNALRLYLFLDDGRKLKLYDTPITFTHKGYVKSLNIYFSKGVSYDNAIFKPLLNKGDKPYDGLINTEVEELVVESPNLLPTIPSLSDTEQYGLTATLNDDGSVTVSGVAATTGKVSWWLHYYKSFSGVPKGTYTIPQMFGASSSTYRINYDFINYSPGDGHKNVLSDFCSGTEDKVIYFEREVNVISSKIEYHATTGELVNITYYPMLCAGPKALPYSKGGTIDTFSISDELRAFLEPHGYGKGVNADYHNYIDFERKKFEEKVYSVRPTINQINASFISGQTTYRYYINVVTCPELETRLYGRDIPSICDKLNAVSYYEDAVGYYLDSGSKAIYIKSPYSTTKETIAWFNNLGAEFVLPREKTGSIDIPEDLSDGNIIEVAGGATIIAKNNYELNVPSTITYVKQRGEI